MYFDDLAVWVRTQKGSIVRGIVCALLVLIGIFGIIGQWRQHDKLNEIVDRNKNTLATQSFEVQQLDNKIAEFDQTRLTDSQSVSEVGGRIAELQSKYGGFLDLNANPAVIAENQQQIEQDLRQYIVDGLRRYEWYGQRRVSYTWECMSNTSFLMNGATTLPIVFKCTIPAQNRVTMIPLSVALGSIDVTTGKLVTLQIWNTKGGEELMQETGEILNAQPSFGRIFTYDMYSGDRELWMRVYRGESLDVLSEEDDLTDLEQTETDESDQEDTVDENTDVENGDEFLDIENTDIENTDSGEGSSNG